MHALLLQIHHALNRQPPRQLPNRQPHKLTPFLIKWVAGQPPARIPSLGEGAVLCANVSMRLKCKGASRKQPLSFNTNGCLSQG